MQNNNASLVDLGRSLIDDARSLVRKEIELAKVEILDLIKTNAIAVGMFAGAAIVAFMAFILLQIAVIITLLVTVGPSAAWYLAWGLVVLWVVVIAVLALMGKSKLRIKAPEKTVATIKGDIEWAKEQIHSNAR